MKLMCNKSISSTVLQVHTGLNIYRSSFSQVFDKIFWKIHMAMPVMESLFKLKTLAQMLTANFAEFSGNTFF